MTTTVHSQDGTPIAYEKIGQGPPLILVDGALCYRDFGPARKFAAALSQRFTVYIYDRRGRGESGDTQPYAVAREIEDLEALIERIGGPVSACGFSSGAALLLEAAQRGARFERLALYEPPFIVDDSRPPLARDYDEQLAGLLAEDRRGDMVRLFMQQVGLPRALIAVMRLMPSWSKLTAVAPTLRYDAAIMDGRQAGEPLPAGRWNDVGVRTLVVAGGKSPAWMQTGMRALTEVLPNPEHLVLDGQTHMVKPKVLAPVLIDYLERARGSRPAAYRNRHEVATTG